jgi:hypothetical protein
MPLEVPKLSAIYLNPLCFRPPKDAEVLGGYDSIFGPLGGENTEWISWTCVSFQAKALLTKISVPREC